MIEKKKLREKFLKIRSSIKNKEEKEKDLQKALWYLIRMLKDEWFILYRGREELVLLLVVHIFSFKSLPHHVKIVHDLLTEKDGESTYKIRCISDEVRSGVKFSNR